VTLYERAIVYGDGTMVRGPGSTQHILHGEQALPLLNGIRSHSAASTAPVAKPVRPKASWVMMIRSAALVQLTLCLPGTSPVRSLVDLAQGQGQEQGQGMTVRSPLRLLLVLELPPRIPLRPQVDVAGQRDRRAAGGVELVDVVDLIDDGRCT
jgi:hypothetical protein